MELNSKQRAYLRGIANTLPAILQIGKGGITQSVLEQLSAVLTARELIKITILETSQLRAREAAGLLAEPLRAEIVQCIGRKLVLYRENPERKRIEIP